MAAEGELQNFRTPGGHLRITRESVEAARNGTKEKRENAGPSPVLRNRRERVEELALAAQELRAQHELDKLRREQEEEQAELEAEAAAQERQADRDAEAQRLRLERVRIQQKRHEQEQQETAMLASWRIQWLEKAIEKLPPWLSPLQRKETLRTLEAEINTRGPESTCIMDRLTGDIIADVTAPWEAEREARELRERIAGEVQHILPYGTKPDERIKAEALVSRALRTLPLTASEAECRDIARESIAELRAAIERRKATEETRLRRAVLIDYAVGRVCWYLLTLHNRGEIEDEEFTDWELRRDLETTVRDILEEELQGDGAERDVEERMHEIVDNELGLGEAGGDEEQEY